MRARRRCPSSRRRRRCPARPPRRPKNGSPVLRAIDRPGPAERRRNVREHRDRARGSSRRHAARAPPVRRRGTTGRSVRRGDDATALPERDPAVERRAVVVDEQPRVRNRDPVRPADLGQPLRHRLGRDHVARDHEERARELPRPGRARRSWRARRVGGDAAARRRHARRARALEARHRRALEDAHAALERHAAQPAREQRRLNGRGRRLEHAREMRRRAGAPRDLRRARVGSNGSRAGSLGGSTVASQAPICASLVAVQSQPS